MLQNVCNLQTYTHEAPLPVSMQQPHSSAWTAQAATIWEGNKIASV